MTKKQIISYISLIIIHELVMTILYFNYSFLVVGWEKALARKIIITLLAIIPVIHIFSYKLKNMVFDKVIIIVNWVVLSAAVVFAIFKPFVLSSSSYDLFLTKATYVLNPAISLAYILFISTVVLLLPRIKKYNFNKIVKLFIPVIIWVIIRVLFIFIETPIS